MSNFYKVLIFSVVLFSTFFFQYTLAQTDTQFWFAAPDVASKHGDNPIFLRFSTFDKPATIVISMPADASFAPIVINLAAFSTHSENLTTRKNQIETPRLSAIATKDSLVFRDYTTKYPSGILVESTAKITAYYEVNVGNNPDIFALKGRNALGTNFYVPMQTTWNHQNTTLAPTNGHSGFVIVATEDNTTVTITTSKATRSFPHNTTTPNGRPAGTYTYTLNRGEVINIAAFEPSAGNAPFGSRVQANKPIAITVFHDSIRTTTGGCYDLAGDQLVPVNIIGKEYIVMRGRLGRKNDGTNSLNQPERVFILATQNSTTINVNREGTTLTPVTINAGQQHLVDLDTLSLRAYISANKPVYVMHMSGYGCETGAALLPPIDCTGSRLVQFNRSTTESFSLTLMVKTGGEGNFKLNNVAIPSALFTSVPGTGGAWKSARLTYANGTSTVSGTTVPSGVNKIENSSTLFHMGITNGGESSGCRYGYFSSFNSLNIGLDINIFYGTNIVLDAETFGALSYLWSPGGQTTPQITVNARRSTNYNVAVNVGGCTLRDTVCVGTIEYVWVGDVNSDFDNLSNWSLPCGENRLPDCARDIVIPALIDGLPPLNFPIIKNTQNCRNLIIENGATLGFSGTGKLNVCGDMTHSGFLNMPNGTTLEFIGTQPQTYTRTATGTGNFAHLRINNQTSTEARVKVSASGAQNMIIHNYGTLTFVRGLIQTEGTKEVVVLNPSPTSIIGYPTANAATTSFVGGRLRRYINTTGDYNFPVGLVQESVGAPTPIAGKNATIVGTVAADWIVDISFCALNQIANNHIINLTNNNVLATSTTATNLKHILLPPSVAITGDDSRTLETWLKMPSGQNSGGAIFYMGTPAFKQLFALRKNGAGTAFQIDLGGGFVDNFDITGSNDGNWHHYAMTYNGTKIEVYMDGSLKRTLNVTELSTNLSTSKFYVGRYESSTGQNWYLSGRYDNVRTWDYARNPDEILLNLCTYYLCTNPPGLLAAYDMEDGFGLAYHKTRNCGLSLVQYERARVNFQTPITDATNLLAYFNQYPSTTPMSPNEYRCGSNFGTCAALNHGFWTISAYTNSLTQVTGNGSYWMTLYNNAYTNVCGTAHAVIMKRNTSANPWSIPLAPPVLCEDDNVTSTGMSRMTGFSDFAIAQTTIPVILPVDLLSLTAKPLLNSILVEWKTANEMDNIGFGVMRSLDGEKFEEIGWLSPNANQSYSFEDKEAQTNKKYYYRLRQLNATGLDKTSPVVEAMLKGEAINDIRVYPNPTQETFTLNLGDSFIQGKTYRVEMYNSIGMLLERHQMVQQLNDFSLKNRPRGVYLLLVTTPNATYTIKVEKE